MRIPFDISKRPQIESGEYKVETKDHHFVRIICWNKNTGGLDRIVALVAGYSGQEKTLHYTEEGWCCATGNNRDKDLLIVTPEPEMSEIEISLLSWLSDDTSGEIPMERMKQVVKARAAELLDLAKQQLLQSGELLTQEHHEKLMETQYKETLDGVKKNWHDYFTPQAMTDIYNAGRNDVLKDLPRWRKCEKPFDSPDNCGYNGKNLIHHGYALSIDNAYTKLPKDE